MFEKYFIKNLKDGEEKEKIIREYSLVYFWSYFFSFVLIIASFFLLYPLLRLGSWGVIIFLLLFLSGVIIFLRRFFIWSLNVFLITNKRVINFDQKGLFNKKVTEIIFANIVDISYNKKGIFPTIFNYGNVIIKTASDETNLEIKNVQDPAHVQETLADYQYKLNKKN